MYAGIHFPSRCTSFSPSLHLSLLPALHPSVSFFLSAQTVSFCSLQGKCLMLWTDLSFLKDCWHLCTAHLKLLLAHFYRASTYRHLEISTMYFLLYRTLKKVNISLSLLLSSLCNLYDCLKFNILFTPL